VKNTKKIFSAAVSKVAGLNESRMDFDDTEEMKE